jgi:hypothetical protein
MGLQFYKVSMKPVYDDVGISSAYLQGIFTWDAKDLAEKDIAPLCWIKSFAIDEKPCNILLNRSFSSLLTVQLEMTQVRKGRHAWIKNATC